MEGRFCSHDITVSSTVTNQKVQVRLFPWGRNDVRSMGDCLYQLIGITVLCALSGIALANDNALTNTAAKLQYVNGSWVNVRLRPETDATVIDHVITNTQVRVINEAASNGFCQVSYDEGKQGYVACRLLGESPLSLDAIDKPFIDTRRRTLVYSTGEAAPSLVEFVNPLGNSGSNPSIAHNPLYSPLRAFWIRPSVERLFAAGHHFEKTLLKPDELAAERESVKKSRDFNMKVRRFPIPEYEAMKWRLQSGTMGALDGNYQMPVTWQAIKNNAGEVVKGEQRPMIAEFETAEGYIAFVHTMELPAIKQSLFHKDVQPVPHYITTEAASALFGMSYGAEVKSGPSWVPPGHYDDNDDFYLNGAWDVGEMETYLLSPANRHTLFRDGVLLTEQTDIRRDRRPMGSADGCNEGFLLGDVGFDLSRERYEYLKRGGRLYHFFTKGSLPSAKARVIRGHSKFNVAGFIEAETLRYDIDNDDVDDIFVWAGTRMSRSLDSVNWPQEDYRMFFFNVEGEWLLFGVDGFTYSCGC